MPELIAPAGNFAKLKTALAFGADAVYFGLPAFSLRARLNEFTPAKIARACAYAHKLKRKAYVTVNIFAHNRHLKRLPQHIRQLRQAGADAVIVSDPGVLRLVKKHWPQAKIHLSTQANCLNIEAVKFWAQYVERIILAREVSLADIKAIRKAAPKVELEYFVHGAMCLAYSGRCLLSYFFTGRSANLGDCAQPCRWPYQLKIIDRQGRAKDLSRWRFLISPPDRPAIAVEPTKQGTYFLNSHDLNLLAELKKLSQAGVSAFKIEGRTKSVYYLATVVGAYRAALKAIASQKNPQKELVYLSQELTDKLYHRGYSRGFLFKNSQPGQLTKQASRPAKWEFCGQVVKVSQKAGGWQLLVKVHNTLRVGEEIEILQPDYDIIKIDLTKMVDKDSQEEITEAHGGRNQQVIINVRRQIAVYSLLRRRLKKA